MTVTFCGHKNVYQSERVAEQVRQITEELIKEGANEFLLGGYGSFDSIAASVVKSMKQQYPIIRSTLVLPYLDRDYNKDLYDDSVYPPLENVPQKFAITRRNEWMVDQADIVVAYVTHDWGGAAATLKYAERKKKRIIRIG